MIPRKPAVVVTWADAWGEDEDVELKYIDHAPMITRTIGWLLLNDEVGCTIAMDSYIDEEHQNSYRNTAFIPALMITEIQYLS